jgi:segregation and condensation protein B
MPELVRSFESADWKGSAATFGKHRIFIHLPHWYKRPIADFRSVLLDRELLKSVVEGLVFASSDPLTPKALSQVIDRASVDDIQSVLGELEQEYQRRSRGFRLCEVAGGYQFRSLPTIAPWILEMKKIKPSRLSRAALEALAIIAYNQPVTKARIESIRGVESSGTIRNLLERDLIEVVGRKDVPGRPILYGTSKRFLEVFGLSDLASLPPLPDVEPLEEDFQEGDLQESMQTDE